MTTRDLVAIAGSNLLRMKLRTTLSVAGVVIAVGAFVAMLSFGAGNQQLIAEQYDRFGLLFTMQVYPERDTDTSRVRALDDEAVRQLGSIPGVQSAYPLDAFKVQVRLGDSSVSSQAQGVTRWASETPMFTRLRAGSPLSGDGSREALVAMRLLRDLGVEDADSAVGQHLELSVRLSRLDSALVSVFENRRGELRARLRDIHFDSLVYRPYLMQTVQDELAAALERFLDGLTQRRVLIIDTFVIRGVLESNTVGRRGTEPLILPQQQAARLTAGGLSDDPAELFAAMSQGRLPLGLGYNDARSYPRVTLHLDPDTPYQPVKDSVATLGFRSFSYAEQFDEIRQFFLYFDLALGLIGMIALLTASLGIANTLIMAIMERRREIGVLKSLGADDRDIRFLFLCESGTIGAMGAVGGIILGWLVSRLGSWIARTVMESRGVEPVDFFAVPIWLIGAAMAVGVLVSVAAGLYPAGRAARVDPVSALRSE